MTKRAGAPLELCRDGCPLLSAYTGLGAPALWVFVSFVMRVSNDITGLALADSESRVPPHNSDYLEAQPGPLSL